MPNSSIAPKEHMPTEIVVSQPAAITHTPNAMELIHTAIMQGASIDTIERLTKLQREHVEYEAKVAFESAMHRVQSNMKRISADAVNPQTKSRYASYAKLDSVLRPIYSREGISLSFTNADCPIPEHIRIVCYVSREGHTRLYQMDVPADGKGAKGGDVMTKTHARGAAESYGMRYLLKMIFNVAVGEDDNDGNAVEARPPQSGEQLPVEEYAEYMEAIEGARDVNSLQAAFKGAYKAALEVSDQSAINAFVKAKDKRKADIA